MKSENPYSSPVVDGDQVKSEGPDDESLVSIARATFLAWEKLRVIYIGVLAGLTLLLVALESGPLLTSLRFWATAIQGAIGANVCYFAGPIVETYVTWLGLRARWLRTLLFVGGTLLSCLLTLAVVAGFVIPDMD